MFKRSRPILLDVVLFTPVVIFVVVVWTHGFMKATDVKKTLINALAIVENR